MIAVILSIFPEPITQVQKVISARSPISSYFGMRKHPITGAFRMHKGVDFAHNTGAPIKASLSGFVEYIGYNGGYGNFIKIKNKDCICSHE